MSKLTAAIGVAALTLIGQGAVANPWKILDGSKLLDGTETAVSVSGYMFSGKEYEVTTAQFNLRCSEGEAVFRVVGDSDFLTRAQADRSPEIDVIIKVGEQLATYRATLTSGAFNRDSARLQDGPALLALLRHHDGQSAQVQVPVARTGVPEVRKLSLDAITETTDVLLATCGPLKPWRPEAPDDSLDAPKATSETPLPLDQQIALGVITKVIENMVRTGEATPEDILKAVAGLKSPASDPGD